MEDENKIIDAIKNIPAEGTAISILEQMHNDGIQEIIISEKKVLLPKVELNRGHCFNNIEKFCAYLEQFKSKSTVVYFDADAGLAHCVLDEYKTEGQPEIISCVVLNKKLFDTIAIIERIQSSGELLQFAKNNKKKLTDFIAFYQTMSALKVSSSVEKLEVQGKSSEYSYIVKAEVKGIVKGGPVELPDRLIFRFDDMNANLLLPVSYFISADIYYTVRKDTEIFIEIKVENKYELRNEMVLSYLLELEKHIPKDVLLVRGVPNYNVVKRYNTND
jgi:hypothetical protein